MNSRRLQGFKFGVNTKEVIVEDEAEEPNLDHPKASKFRSALSSALNKKFNRESENTAQKNVPLTIGSIRVGTISDRKSERGYLKEGHEENPITVNTSSKSTLNISLLRAVNKFRNKSNMMKRKEGEASSIGSHQLVIAQLDKSSKTKIQRQTIVGKIIIEKNTKILILLVLIMMFAMILFSGSLYEDQSQSCDSDILMLRDLRPAEGDTAAKIEFDALAEFTIHRKFEDMQIIDYHIPGFGVMERGQEYWESMVINCTTEYTAPDGSKGTMHISLWTKKQSTLEAILNILKMVFLISVLFLGSYMFTVDANTLILNPIENIICLVNMIAKNPDVSEQLIALQDKDKNKKTNEFKQVEKAILKLGNLLVLVFGRAGNNVIYQNISNIHKEEIDVETIGSQSMAIFGFCDIRNFTDMTEILEEDIMPFVNNVARVVHNSVATFMGSANKNIGEAFLLVWNLPEECLVREESEGDLLSTSNIFLERYAESAVASFVDIIIKLESCKEVQNFADLPKVQKMLPGFKVNMGFGLHLGWAIEGAIGSEWKIDASYLSPNVNISSRLEAATMQYGVPLLISHYIVNILSQKTRNYCRKIDRVTLKGSEEPIELYTIDLRTKFQPTSRNARFSSLLNVPVQNKQVYNSLVLQLSPAELKLKYLQEDFNFNIESLVPPVVIHYLKDDRFYSQFSKAIDSYLAGKWHQARELLESCKMRRPKDGPTLNILEFINSHKSSAPQSWQGVRQLVAK